MSIVYQRFCPHTVHYAKSLYALALNGNARNHNEKRIVGRVRSAFAKQNTKTRLLPTTKLSTFPLILARLSLRSCLCSGCLDYCFTPSSRSHILQCKIVAHYFGAISCWVRFAHTVHYAKSLYALALNGTVYVCNESSTLPLTHVQLSLTLVPLLGLKKRPLYRGQGWLFLGYIVLCQIFLSYFF